MMNKNELTLRPYYWRATNLFPEKELVSRMHDEIFYYTYGEFGERVAKLANALSNIGIGIGSRVGTIGWNHHHHFEAYYAVPLIGAQLHTINPVLPDEKIEYIINDARDDILFVDPNGPTEVLDRIWENLNSDPKVVVMGKTSSNPESDSVAIDYESFINNVEPIEEWPELTEDLPAGMCYTSGTTGMPKGVEYTQKMIYTHAMMTMTPSALNISERDVVMPVVPMFHVNSWEFPYAVTMAGAKQVYPGPSPSSADLAHLIEQEGVTLTAGVPTVWINLLEYLEEHDRDISTLERIIVGGSATPKSVIQHYNDKYNVAIEHAWGMTETMSIGSVSRVKSNLLNISMDEELNLLTKQGLLSPGLEMRVVQDSKEVPWDGKTSGELWVRGPTVVNSYYNCSDESKDNFEDGWLKTGDIVVIDTNGYIEVVDRKKDVIKSGGEWISSIELENELMSHNAVAEAAVISVPHERWQERPFACVVLRQGFEIDANKLHNEIRDKFERWQLPDNIVFLDEIPKTATGKFDKKTLRSQFKNPELRWTPGE